MRTEKLIDILARENNPVKPLKHPLIRFSIWLLLSASLIVFIFPVIEHFFGHGFTLTRDLTGVLILLLSALVLGFLAFVMNSPVILSPAVKIVVGGIFFIWILRTFLKLFYMDESFMDHMQAMYSGSPHTGCMTNTYLFFTIPFFILIIMLRSGYTLEKTWAGFYAATASLSVAELLTTAMCPQTDPVHTLAWHILPVAPIPVVIWLLSEKLLKRRG